MVWVVDLEVAGQRACESFIITAGESGNRREITVGRPPTKTDAKPDIVVMGKSVSKTHAVLYMDLEESDVGIANRLTLEDKSRYGTTINNQKLRTGGTQVLSVGDTIQIAPQTFLMVRQLPLVVALRPDEPLMGAVREAAQRAGAQISHEFNDGITHVFYVPGEPVWSALTHGLLHCKQLVDLEWLRRVAGAGLLVGSLPEPPQVGEVLLRGGLAGGPVTTRVALPPPCAGAQHGLLAGFTFGFSNTWRDTGLTALLTDLGGRVVASQAELGLGGSVVEVVNDGSGGGSGSSSHPGAGQQTLRVSELLIRLLTDDAGGVRDVLSAVRRCAVPAIPAAPEPGSEPEDSDMTQAADDGEEDEAVGGEVQQQQQQQAGNMARDDWRKAGADEPAAGVPSIGAVTAARVSRQHPQQASSARDQAADASGILPATEAAPTDGWMMAARRPEDTDQGHSGLHPPASLHDCASPTHEDGPPPKRRRTLSTLTSTGKSTLTPSPPAALAPPSAPIPTLPPSIRPSPAPVKPPAPTPAPLKAPLQLYAIKQEDGGGARGTDASGWMTQPRRASACHGMMTQAPALPPPVLAPAAATVKQEPAPTKRTAGGRAKGKAGKAAANSAAGDIALEVPERRGEDLPQVNDASAQVVMEVPLLAATPEQQPQRYRSASMEPSGQIAGVTGGGGGGFSYNGNSGDASSGPSSLDQLGELEVALPDYKAFRKQGAGPARGPAVVQPLPVFVVDNFDNSDEAAAFLKQEEERVKLKRTADEAFKSAGTGPGGKRPPRAPKRG